MTVVRARIRVEGVVQGVGFRPFAHALATRLALGGLVGNDSDGVFVEVEGEAAAVEEFQQTLRSDAPPLAVIERIVAESVAPRGEREFAIVASRAGSTRHTLVSPDSATCADCLVEIADPADRRYRHPFASCTHCGPRFTTVTDVPYDRPATTMAGFPMCPDCAAEYADRADRRFHAQPICCPVCGPRLRLVVADAAPDCSDAARDCSKVAFLPQDGSKATLLPPGHGADGCSEGPDGEDRNGEDPIIEAARLLDAGAVLAVKGLGGFHIAVDAANERAVAALRSRKHREDKPFAVMVADLDAARRLCDVDPAGALCGGVWQNMLLLATAVDTLERAGFQVLVHSRVPTNDGGISLGQAAVAAARG